jgi:hypothetical protein
VFDSKKDYASLDSLRDDTVGEFLSFMRIFGGTVILTLINSDVLDQQRTYAAAWNFWQYGLHCIYGFLVTTIYDSQYFLMYREIQEAKEAIQEDRSPREDFGTMISRLQGRSSKLFVFTFLLTVLNTFVGYHTNAPSNCIGLIKLLIPDFIVIFSWLILGRIIGRETCEPDSYNWVSKSQLNKLNVQNNVAGNLTLRVVYLFSKTWSSRFIFALCLTVLARIFQLLV